MRNTCVILVAACWLACIPAALAQQGDPVTGAEPAPAGKAAEPGSAPFERSARAGNAPPDRTFTLGVGIGVINVAGEQAFSGDTPATTLFTDLNFGRWAQFRIGVGQYSAVLQESTLTTQTVDLVYMIGGQFLGPLEGYALIGISQVSSTLEVAGAGESVSSAGTGNLLGGMLVYRLGSFRLGGQLVVIGHTGDFGGVAIADGSSQLQLVAAIDWF